MESMLYFPWTSLGDFMSMESMILFGYGCGDRRRAHICVEKVTFLGLQNPQDHGFFVKKICRKTSALNIGLVHDAGHGLMACLEVRSSMVDEESIEKDRLALIPFDAGPRVRACLEVPKHVSTDTIMSSPQTQSMRMHRKRDKTQFYLSINSL